MKTVNKVYSFLNSFLGHLSVASVCVRYFSVFSCCGYHELQWLLSSLANVNVESSQLRPHHTFLEKNRVGKLARQW